jgi:tetratricopeptide (TPR) repeat protein
MLTNQALMMRLETFLLLFLTACLLTLLPSAAPAQAVGADKVKDSLRHALAHPKDDTSKIKTLYALGTAYVASDSATAADYANECRKLSVQDNWPKGLGLYYLLMTKVYSHSAHFDACLQSAREAWLIFNKTEDKKNTAAALVFMANSYHATGFFARSIENNLAALAIYESLQNTHGESLCYNNIGVNYYNLREYDKAIGQYRKALDLRKAEGDKYAIGSDLDNISMVYLDKGNYDSADLYNREGIEMFEAAGDQPALGRIYANRGYILIKKYDARSAEEYNRKSLAIDERLGIADGMSYGYGFLGEIYLDLAKDSAGRYTAPPFMKKNRKILLDSAEFYVTKALLWAHKAGDINILMSHNLLFAGIEEELGHYPRALAAHKEYTKYRDSIFNDENKQKIASLESERLTQTKDQEIALQAAEAKRQSLLKKVVLVGAGLIVVLLCASALVYNRRKKARFDNKVMEVEMSALRAQMNPHFISNALHSINNYVMENDKRNASGYLTKFASLMRLILEHSREREVLLKEDLQALELYLQLELLRFNHSFTYHIDVDPLIDPENTLVPPMLLQPFAENAILHGLPDKENGRIGIKVHKVNNMICYVIEDNGTGGLRGPASTPVDGKTRKSLGRKIVHERLSIINRLKKAKATVSTVQLKDVANQPCGLRIELLLPFEPAF